MIEHQQRFITYPDLPDIIGSLKKTSFSSPGLNVEKKCSLLVKVEREIGLSLKSILFRHCYIFYNTSSIYQ